MVYRPILSLSHSVCSAHILTLSYNYSVQYYQYLRNIVRLQVVILNSLPSLEANIYQLDCCLE